MDGYSIGIACILNNHVVHAQLTAPPSESLAWRLHGYCDTTGVDQAGCHSLRAKKGTWSGVRSLRSCINNCLNCTRCNFISFSEGHRDCSWFGACRIDQLHTALSRAHYTYQLRNLTSGAKRADVATRLSADMSDKKRDTQVHRSRSASLDEWYERPSLGQLLLHEGSALSQFVHSRLTSFRSIRSGVTPAEVRRWANAIRARAPALSSSWRSCAVVGSSASLLAPTPGGDGRTAAAINAHGEFTRRIVQTYVARRVSVATCVGARGHTNAVPHMRLACAASTHRAPYVHYMLFTLLSVWYTLAGVLQPHHEGPSPIWAFPHVGLPARAFPHSRLLMDLPPSPHRRRAHSGVGLA